MNEAQKISGKVVEVIPEISGTKGDKAWTKQQFVIETPGQYPKKVVFQCWNDKCDLIPKVGTEVAVSYNPESREYNDKWYTDLSVFNIEVTGAVPITTSKTPATKTGTTSGGTFTQGSVKTGLDIQGEDDDLPF